MAFKTFYSLIWIFLILFTVVKGSCLEYGHSCWGAHGKRSGNNKIFHADVKSPTELDFLDLNGIKDAINEKNTYQSTEDDLNGSQHDLTKYKGNILESSEQSNNFKKLFYEQFKKNLKQHNSEPPEHKPQPADNSLPLISERWRRLPLYNLRQRLQISNPDNEWLREFESETQNDADYI